MADDSLSPPRTSRIPSHLEASLADRYHIEREIAHGGMATVYLAKAAMHMASLVEVD